MRRGLFEDLEEEGFEELLLLTDPAAGLRAVLAVHDTSPGVAFGGIRRLAYPDERTQVEDALRLARAMSHKLALAGLPAGGAKLALRDHPELDRSRAYRAIGALLERQGGRWYAGPDTGTGKAELALVAEVSEHVARPDERGPGQLAEATAHGVLGGILAALTLEGRALEGARVVVQGLGQVGLALVELLVERGARVAASDLDPQRASRAVAAGAAQLACGTELEEPADVFSPCALGGVLTPRSCASLAAPIVCGAANNALSDEGVADELRARGVCYVPDVLVNSGAVIRGVVHRLQGRRIPLLEIEERIGQKTAEVLRTARSRDRTPSGVALEEAERVLRERRANSFPTRS